MIIVEPGGPRPVSPALVFLVYGEIMSFKCKENHHLPGLAFCCCGRFRCSLRFFLFLFFRCFSFHSRARILIKSAPGRPPDCRLLGPPFLVLVQGFSIKVLMQKYCLHDDSCSRTRILTRSGNSENIVCLRCALSYKDMQQINIFLRFSRVSFSYKGSL